MFLENHLYFMLKKIKDTILFIFQNNLQNLTRMNSQNKCMTLLRDFLQKKIDFKNQLDN